MKKPVKKAKVPVKPDYYYFGVLAKVLESVRDMRAETNERLRVIESDINAIQHYIGILAITKRQAE